jgi:hypothetical protein
MKLPVLLIYAPQSDLEPIWAPEQQHQASRHGQSRNRTVGTVLLGGGGGAHWWEGTLELLEAF